MFNHTVGPALSDVYAVSLGSPLRIMLYDDDPVFLKIAQRIAERHDTHLITCQNFEEFSKRWKTQLPDAVILDYHIDKDLTAPEVAHLFDHTPVVLISRKANWLPEPQSWHPAIKEFCHKKYGFDKILEKAMKWAEAARLDRVIENNLDCKGVA